MSDLKSVNNKLIRLYGMSQHDITKARFQVKPTANYTEQQYGEFEGHTASGIYVGTRKGWMEVLKYRMFPDARFVLEELFINHHKDLEGKTRYEPLWTFPHNRPLIWKAVQFLIEIRLGIRTDPDKPRSDADVGRLIEKSLKKEEEYAFEVFGGRATAADLIHYGSGIFIDSTKRHS